MCVGTLAQVIDGSYKGPKLPSDVSVLRDIASGIYYIHMEKMIHRNIKPDNILISKDARIKISDIGYADSIIHGGNCWLSPEMLAITRIGEKSDRSISRKVTHSSDIFSAGCVFFFFLTRRVGGVHPFGNDYIEQSHNIRKNHPVNAECKLNFLL